MPDELTRRDWLTMAPAALGAGLAAATAGAAPAGELPAAEPFGYCLNTSTIQGQNLPIDEVVVVAAKAGYRAIEPWMRELDRFVKSGGSIRDLRRRIDDLGLSVESAIGFCEWAVDEDDRRRAGLEQARRDMALLQQLGGKRIAAPPVGVTKQTDLDLLRVAERYRALLELGATMGIVPQVEIWGFSRSLGRLGEALLVAVESGHPAACILPDVHHLNKGGSGFGGIRLLGPHACHVFHLNDYPASPPRADLTDAHRVYPGDGIAPLKELLRDLRGIGFRGVLSLELFNREYWKQDALTVARTGLEKMRALVRESLT